MTSIELWAEEFGEGWQVPPAILNDEQIEDCSWHNDVCPSFIMRAPSDAIYDLPIRLWVDHAEVDQREWPEFGKRFTVSTGEGDVLFETDDNVEAAIEMLKLFSRLSWKENVDPDDEPAEFSNYQE